MSRASRGPPHLAEARALRAGLGGRPRSDGAVARPSPARLARIRLLEGQPDAALGALGGAARPTCPPTLARARRRARVRRQRAAARRCYELASAAGDQASLARLARLDARLPDAELRTADRARSSARPASEIPAAFWALARLDTRRATTAALARADRALALAARPAAEEPRRRPTAGPRRPRPRERALAGRGAPREEAGGARRRRATSAAPARWRWRCSALVAADRAPPLHGRTVAAALRRSPSLFPDVGRAVADLRHDVLKHRAGVLGLVADPRVAAATTSAAR